MDQTGGWVPKRKDPATFWQVCTSNNLPVLSQRNLQLCTKVAVYQGEENAQIFQGLLVTVDIDP